MADGTTREALAVQYGTIATHAALHTADPGTGLTSEVTGTGYARQPLTWAAGTAGDGIVTATATFTVPANVSVLYTTTCTGLTGGRQVDKVSAVYNSQPAAGQLTVNFQYAQN